MSLNETAPEEVESVVIDPVAEGEDASGAGEDQETSDNLEEVVVSIGDPVEIPDPAEKAPEWVRELRKSSREKDRRIKELEQKLHQVEPKPTVALGPKPKMEDPDIDYDEDKFTERVSQWLYRKKEIESEEAKKKAESEKAEKDWQDKLDGYQLMKQKAKSEMRLEDFDEAEADAMELFSTTQKGIIIHGSENPALLMYALGKDPKIAAEYAKTTDPVKFAFDIAKLEATKLKVSKKSGGVPPPERKLNGSGPISGTVDQNLERLRAEAAKTGDYSKVARYKEQLRAKASQKD